MVKIKTKKQLTLPQLIEWVWDNDDATGVRFQSDGFVTTVYFGKNGDVSVEDCSKDARFTIEVEEDITEDTKLDLIERFIGGMDHVCYTSHGNTTIKECLKRSPRDCTTTHIYIENDDRELVLIWKDGKLI